MRIKEKLIKENIFKDFQNNIIIIKLNIKILKYNKYLFLIGLNYIFELDLLFIIINFDYFFNIICFNCILYIYYL